MRQKAISKILRSQNCNKRQTIEIISLIEKDRDM
jgi:hypothetical protein